MGDLHSATCSAYSILFLFDMPTPATLIEKIESRVAEEKPFFSLEFFPPRTKAGAVNLFARFDRLAVGEPLFIDVTWGAGGGDPSGNNCTGSLAVASNAINYCGLPTMLHLTSINISKEEIRTILNRAKDMGIRNILALRGDMPVNDQTYDPEQSEFKYASDLVRFIREEYGNFFGICVAGYPNGHPDCTSLEDDLENLKKKVEAGADFIITQLFFDADTFIQFVKKCRDIGINCPIIPGILPIQSFASIRHLMKLSKLRPPEKILKEIEARKDDDAAVRQYGVQIAVDMCKKILASKCTYGFHFYTLNRELAVKQIVQELGLWNPNGVCSKDMPWLCSANDKRQHEGIRPIFWSTRPKSYLMRTKDWDEYPNGRWGDSSSPAFGNLAEYYLFKSPGVTSEQKKTMWGTSPVTVNELGETFCRFLRGEISCLPWSEEASLSPETKVLEERLINLNKHGILTTNSQPSVNGVSSSHPVHGWGGEGGYVYQKAYLEFFLSPELFRKLLEILKDYASFTYHAINRAGESHANGSDNVNAVTWGVFPQKEIIQPTVVDPESFPIWKDEAFELWKSEWQALYPEDSPSYELIDEIYDTYYLVNIVDNDFIGGDIFAPFERLLCQINNPK